MISYAQNREDVLLARAFAGQASGFYVDVGAAHPLEHSVTKHLYESGWRGVNVEPTAVFFERLAADRPRDVNVQAVLGTWIGTATLFVAPDAPELSSLSTAQADRVAAEGRRLRPVRVDVTTLARVCEQHAPPIIDLLKIDVEGEERRVIAGGDWSRFRPRLVMIEHILHGVPSSTSPSWEPLLLDAGYELVADDGINRYYVTAGEDELRERLRHPVDVYEPRALIDRLELAKEALRRAGLELPFPEDAESGPEARLHRRIAEHDRTIRWLHGQVSELDRRTAWYHATVAVLDARIAELRGALQAAEDGAGGGAGGIPGGPAA